MLETVELARPHAPVAPHARVIYRYVPLHPIDDLSERARAAAVGRRARLVLAWPTRVQDALGRCVLRGPIAAAIDPGELVGVPDAWHRADHRIEPVAFLRRFARDVDQPWLAQLWLGREAWFTTTGLDVQRIVDAPTSDARGRLRFDLVTP
jgi:hypothetical protein